MKIRYFLISLIALSVFISSCDEINKLINPSSDDYLIDKTVSASTTEQIIESGSEFQMIFPANSLKGNLEIKVKKESSYPTFSFSSTQLGKNVYKIKFSGESSFQSPAKIIINYDISKVPGGKTASETIKAYICSNGIWKLSNYTLNESQKQLIISISNLDNPKIDKDNPKLQDNEGDIIIGDGYTTTDTGNNDNPLAVASKFYVYFTSHSQTSRRNILSNQFNKGLQTDITKLTFSGNSFSASYVSDPNADLENVNPGQTLDFNYIKFSLKGEIDNKNYKKFKSFVISESRYFTCAGWAETWYDQKSTLSINDLDLTYESKNKDTLIYDIKEASKSPYIKSFSWLVDDKLNNLKYAEYKADLTGLIIIFIK